MCFLKNKFEYFTVVTKTFISNFINLIYCKIILHHSHVTGQIIGFGQDFCNQKVRECKGFFSLLAHNLVGFDFFFVVKGIRLWVWRTNNFCKGGSDLSNVNYAYIVDQVKFTETMKFHLKSLKKLEETVTESKKEKIDPDCKNFLQKHQYFKNIYNNLNKEDQIWILNYLSITKGVAPYEKMKNHKSLQSFS